MNKFTKLGRLPQRVILTLIVIVIGVVVSLGVTHTLLSAAQVTPIVPTFGAISAGASPAGASAVPPNTSVPVTAPPASAVPVTATISPVAVTASPIGSAPATPAVSATLPSTPSLTPTTSPVLRSDLMGIQINPNLNEDQWRFMMDSAQFTGFHWMKLQLSWKELEPQPGQYSLLDRQIVLYIRLAEGRGFHFLVSVAKAPAWARPAQAQGQNDGPPAQPKQLADFIAAMIPRYGLKPSDAIEIWNEPNTVADWTGEPLNAATYLKYFDAAYKAVRSVSTMPIITAGLSPTADGPNSADDRTWLSTLYADGLLKSYPDVIIGVHPYGWANPADAHCCATPSKGWDNNPKFFFLDTLADYRTIMVKNGHQNGKLWATEFGWSSFDGLHYKDHVNGPPAKPPSNPDLGWMSLITASQQSAYTIRAYDIVQHGDYVNYMGPMFLWNLNFASLPGFVSADQDSRSESGFSVLDGDGFPRMLYNVLQATPKQ